MGLVKLKVVTESQYSVIITSQMFRLNTEERKSEEQSWERQEILQAEQVDNNNVRCQSWRFH